MKRRHFLKVGSSLAATAVMIPLFSDRLLGANTDIHAIPNVTLNNGIKMPMLGFGTNTLNNQTAVNSVSQAIKLGYRLIDTAMIYGNESSVGEGIKKSGISREKLFITSKLWVDDAGYESTQKAFETSINKLGTEYLDLYLIHRPRGDVKGSWKAMEELYIEGKIKAIGVSNFEPEQLSELLSNAKVKPVVNQIETHAFFQHPNDKKILESNNIQMEAWSPLAEGRNNIFTNETLAAIGKKHNKNNAQVSLRWHLQRGIVAIPRSRQKVHMAENLNIFDFELSQEDMKTIEQLDLNITQFPEWS